MSTTQDWSHIFMGPGTAFANFNLLIFLALYFPNTDSPGNAPDKRAQKRCYRPVADPERGRAEDNVSARRHLLQMHTMNYSRCIRE